MRLKDKIAIITGGGSGIGLSTAHAFCKEGAKVVLFGRRKDKLEKAAEKIGGLALPIQGDMNKNDDLDRLINETLNNFKGIDILVNNAGIFNGAPLHEISDSQWDALMDINIRSVFQLTKRVLPVMIAQKKGSIIHISSILGLIAVPQVAAYNVSNGIRSNAICPGLIETDMTADLMQDDSLMQEWSKEYPIGRFGKPDDIASACLYLASDESSFVTGAVLPVDGGFTAH